MSNPTKPDFSRIPLGIPSFPAIRKDQLIYVDKTDKVVELIKSGRYLLLTSLNFESSENCSRSELVSEFWTDSGDEF